MEPIARHAYDELAERFSRIADDKLENAYLDRPATLSLLPEVSGMTVLDAGCGAGAYSEELLRRGAEVIAFDVSPGMVAYARERLGEFARVHLADFSAPLDFLEDESVDLIVCGLALSYVDDLDAVYSEFHRVLRPGGYMVISIGHPWPEMKWSQNQDYFEPEILALDWKGFGEPHVSVPWYRKTLTAYLRPMFRAGFLMDDLLEPKPVPEGREKDPETYDKLSREPGFLCYRALKPGN